MNIVIPGSKRTEARMSFNLLQPTPLDDVTRQARLETHDAFLDDIWANVKTRTRDPREIWDALGDEPQLGIIVGRIVQRAMAGHYRLDQTIKKRLAWYAFEELTEGLDEHARGRLREVLDEHLADAVC